MDDGLASCDWAAFCAEVAAAGEPPPGAVVRRAAAGRGPAVVPGVPSLAVLGTGVLAREWERDQPRRDGSAPLLPVRAAEEPPAPITNGLPASGPDAQPLRPRLVPSDAPLPS